MLSKLKRKYIFIPVMIAFCIGMYYGAVSVQNYYYHKEDAKNKIVSTKNTNSRVPDVKQESSNQTNSASDNSKSGTSSQTSTAKSSSNNSNSTIQQQSQTNKSSSTSSTPAPTSTPAPSKPAQQSNCSITIWDDVNKKTILSTNIYVDGNTSVETITQNVLINNNIHFTDSSGYFREIARLAERKAGDYSGWCYYVNSKKAITGAGSYILQAGDKLEWKYLADGLSN